MFGLGKRKAKQSTKPRAKAKAGTKTPPDNTIDQPPAAPSDAWVPPCEPLPPPPLPKAEPKAKTKSKSAKAKAKA